MGRYTNSGSRDHAIRMIGADHFRVSWVVDRYYYNSRLRHPTIYKRDMDEDGAKRFAAKWGLKMPDAE